MKDILGLCIGKLTTSKSHAKWIQHKTNGEYNSGLGKLDIRILVKEQLNWESLMQKLITCRDHATLQGPKVTHSYKVGNTASSAVQ